MNRLINLFSYGLFYDTASRPEYIVSVTKFMLFGEAVAVYLWESYRTFK